MPNPPKPPKPAISIPVDKDLQPLNIGGIKKAIVESASQRQEQIQKYRELMAKQRGLERKLNLLRRRKSSLLKKPSCFSSISVYGGKSKGRNAFLCHIDSQIKFVEQTWRVNTCEVRAFIEGAEITPYLRDTVQWSIETTGGINSCSLTLNNNNDAFILTPLNICSNLNTKGWFLARDRKGRIITSPYRSSANTDEWAKYKIYKKKYKKVNPGTKGEQIDETGMWLYPLNPYGCIFNKHDSIRVFYRLPHAAGAVKIRNKKYEKYRELWAPAFTGFIDTYDVIDDYVNGDRKITINAKDIRMLLSRMRVRVAGNPVTSANTKDASTNTQTTNDAVAAELQKTAVFTDLKKLGIDLSWLRDIDNQNIAVLFVKLFRALFEDLLEKEGCKAKGAKKYDINCAKRVYNNAQNEVRGRVQEFYSLYKDASGFIAKTNSMDNAGRKIVLIPPNERGQISIKQERAAVDIQKAVNDFLGWLKTDGLVIAQTIDEINNAYEVVKQNISYKPVAKFIVLNNTVEVHNILDKFIEKFSADTDITQALSWTKRRQIDDSTKTLFATIKQRLTSFTVVTDAIKLIFSGTNISSTVPEFGEVDKVYNSSNFKRTKSWSAASDAISAVKSYVAIIDQLSKVNYILPVKADLREVLTSIVEIKFRRLLWDKLPEAPKKSVSKKPTKKGTPPTVGNYQFADSSRNRLRKQIHTYTGAPLEKAGSPGKFSQHFTVQYAHKFMEGLLAFNGDVKETIGDSSYRFKTLLEDLNGAFQTAMNAFKKARNSINTRDKRNQNVRQATRVDRIRKQIQEAQQKGKDNPVSKSEAAGSFADLMHKAPKFTQQNAAMFADLVRAMDRDSHPLAGMSFQTAVKWLTLTHLPTSLGIEMDVTSYEASKMQAWNKVVLFGIIGRPLTYAEVTAVGHGTFTDVDPDTGIFSPLQCFVHLLLPKGGTGAATIVQQEIAHAAGTDRRYEFKTRLELLNKICETLDYQFYVSPFGDMVFEFPMYNGIPSDWGKVFEGAYKISREISSSKISPESGPMYTAWVLNSKEDDKTVEKAVSADIVRQRWRKSVIIAPVLARRLGASVKTIQVKIPGLGGILSPGAGIASLLAYAFLEIQKDLGRMSTMSFSIPFRPYLLPNRSVHVIPRQRMGMIKSVSYTMTPPDGNCTIDVHLSYVRELFRDGTFRTIAGGKRMPVDYSGLFTGSIKYDFRLGPSKSSSRSCAPALKDRYAEASAFHADRLRRLPRSQTYTSDAPGAYGFRAFTEVPYSIVNRLYKTEDGGARLTREPPNPGEKAEAVTRKDTGLDDGKRDKPQPKPRYDLRGLFHNPYIYGVNIHAPGTGSIFSNWGPTRKLFLGRSPVFKRWHNGIDIMVPKGTPIYTPIDCRSHCKIVLGIGYAGHKRRKVKVDEPTWLTFYAPYKIPGTPIKKVVENYTTFIIGYIDYTMYERGKKIKEVTNKSPWFTTKDKTGVSNHIGMYMEIYGYTTLPGDSSKTLKVGLRFGHLDGVAKTPNGRSFYGLKGEYTLPKKGSIVAYVGHTGNTTDNRTPHLHLEMFILKKGSDEEAFNEAKKANIEFLRTIFAMKVTGGNVNSSKMSSNWKRYFDYINRTRRKYKLSPITTVDEAVDYLMRPNSWLNPRVKKSAARNYRNKLLVATGKISVMYTNPFLYFKPEDIFPTEVKRFQKYYKYTGDLFVYRPEKEQQNSLCGLSVNSSKKAAIYRHLAGCLTRASRSKRRRTRISAKRKCRLQFKKDYNKFLAQHSSLSAGNRSIAVARRLDAQVARATRSSTAQKENDSRATKHSKKA